MAKKKKDKKVYAMETPAAGDGLQLTPAGPESPEADPRSRQRQKAGALEISEDLLNRIVKRLKNL